MSDSTTPTAPTPPAAPAAATLPPPETPEPVRQPEVGDRLLFFHAQHKSRRYSGRACRIVDDHGNGRYSVIVDLFDDDLTNGSPVRDQTGRVVGVVFVASRELPPNRRNDGWAWPAEQFIAWQTPDCAAQEDPDDDDGEEVQVHRPIKRPAGAASAPGSAHAAPAGDKPMPLPPKKDKKPDVELVREGERTRRTVEAPIVGQHRGAAGGFRSSAGV